MAIERGEVYCDTDLIIEKGKTFYILKIMNAHYVKMKHKCVNKTDIKICIVEGVGGGGECRGQRLLSLFSCQSHP